MTLSEIGIRNRLAAGDGLVRSTTKTANALAYLWAWAYTTRKLGHAPTHAEHAAEWKLNQRTAEREAQRFREVFGADVEIQPIADWLNATAAEWIASRTKAMQAPAPPFLGALA
jgi:hypothetical protein